MLVTGGEGFVGSHVVAHALARGADVIVLDDRSCPAQPPAALPPGQAHRVERHVGSIMDRPIVEELVARADMVFHLAARVGVRRVLEDRKSVV